MSKFEKLKERLLRIPKDFTYNEFSTLLNGLGYDISNKEKTSGSRVAFVGRDDKHILRIHKPHPKNIVKQYALQYIVDELKMLKKL